MVMVDTMQLAITSSQATLIHPIGGAIAVATAGKVFFKGAIIAAASAISIGAFHKALHDFWKQHLGPNTQMPKAITNCMNGNVNLQGGLKVEVNSLIRFKSYFHPKATDININITIVKSVEFSAGGSKSLRGSLGSQASGGATFQDAHSNKGHNVAPMGALTNASNTPEYANVASIEDSIASLFFTEGDLSLGKKMNLHFTKSPNLAPFLPRDLVDKLPFTLENFHEILNQFNLLDDSTEAKVMKETLKYCEDNVGGDKCCNSLESMVEFAKSIAGNTVKAISSNVDKEMKMEYKVQGVKKLPCAPYAVTCHKIPFPCAMFYCQKEEKMIVYIANLLGSDGSTINIPAVCHQDTSSWDPNHWVFKLFHAKPGSCPICHFLLDDDVLWIGTRLKVNAQLAADKGGSPLRLIVHTSSSLESTDSIIRKDSISESGERRMRDKRGVLVVMQKEPNNDSHVLNETELCIALVLRGRPSE